MQAGGGSVVGTPVRRWSRHLCAPLSPRQDDRGFGGSAMATTARSRWLTAVVAATTTAFASLALVLSPPVASAATQAVAADSFSRTAATGWGSADTGGAWSLSGPANLYSVG